MRWARIDASSRFGRPAGLPLLPGMNPLPVHPPSSFPLLSLLIATISAVFTSGSSLEGIRLVDRLYIHGPRPSSAGWDRVVRERSNLQLSPSIFAAGISSF